LRTYARRPLGASVHFGLALFFLGVAIYGSLVPFTYQPLPWDEAVARWQQARWTDLARGGRVDFASNVLLFIPLGYLFMGALCVDRPRLFALPAAVLVLPPLCVASAAIEFTQIWFPPRVMSVDDIVGESLGAAIGVAAWAFAGGRITQSARAAWSELERRELAARLLPFYLAFLVFVHVMPLDLTINPVEIWHKYKAGRIVLVPFGAPGVGPAEWTSKVAWNAVYFLPVGFLLAGLGGRWRVSGRMALMAGVLVAGGVEFLQLFVWTRYADMTDVLTGTVAVIVGWAGARVWQDRGAATPGPRLRASALAAWIGVLVLANWFPFDFRRNPAEWGETLYSVPLVPFADLYRGSDFHAFEQVVSKTLLFMPLGALLARPGRSTLLAFFTGLALSGVLELGQLGLPTRYASVTDVLVESSATWLGAYLARHFMTVLSRPDAPEAPHAYMPAASR
jgi:glycopeptide antibiotics resistance protein